MVAEPPPVLVTDSPAGRPVAEKVGAGKPFPWYGPALPAVPTVKVAAAGPVIAVGASLTTRSTLTVASEPTPLLAVSTTAWWPPVPGSGLPVIDQWPTPSVVR